MSNKSNIEIVQRSIANLTQASAKAKAIAQTARDTLPVMESGIRKITNATSGQRKTIETMGEALADAMGIIQTASQQISDLTEVIEESNAEIGAGVYHQIEAADDLEAMASQITDQAQIIGMIDLWVQASPELAGVLLTNATDFSLKQAFAKDPELKSRIARLSNE